MRFSHLPVLLRFLLLAVVAGAAVWAPPVYAVEPPPEKTLARLADRIRRELPEGWAVHDHAATGVLIVSRDKKVLTVAEVVSAAAVEVEPEMQTFSFCFRVAPLVGAGDFRRQFAENQEAYREINQLREQVHRVVNTKRDDGMVLPPGSAETMAMMLRYEEVRKTLHRLPDFYFEDASVWSINPTSPRLVDPAVREECGQVRARVEGLFSKYEPQR